jgi:hypothetical protein
MFQCVIIVPQKKCVSNTGAIFTIVVKDIEENYAETKKIVTMNTQFIFLK